MIIGKKAFAKMTLVDKPYLDADLDEEEYMLACGYDSLEDLEGYGDDSLGSHIDDSGSTSAKIHHPSGNEWPAVINSTNHTLSINEISHSDHSIEWECLVRTADAVRLERFSISSPLPLPVVRCFATTGFWVTDPAHGGKITDASGNFVPELDSLLDFDRLVDELCFITIQIMEGRYKGPHRRDIPSDSIAAQEVHGDDSYEWFEK
jgi:hypothetical protein